MNVRRQLAVVNRRVKNIVVRGVVQLSDPSKLMQTLQVTLLKDEVKDNVNHVEAHGFTSRPKQGAEAVLLCPGGNRSSAFAIMVSDRRFRVKDLGEGEVAMYDDANNLIHFKQNKTIAIKSDTSVDVTAPNVTMSGNLIVGGDIISDGDVIDAKGSMQEMRDTFNSHPHPYTDEGSPATTGATTTPMN